MLGLMVLVPLLLLIVPLGLLVVLIVTLSVRGRVRRLEARLEAIERELGARGVSAPAGSSLAVARAALPEAPPARPDGAVETATPEAPPAVVMPPAAAAALPAEPAAVPPVPSPGAAPPPASVIEPPTDAARGGTPASGAEWRLGAAWLNRVGVVILVLGIGFFLKYAFDNDWIGPAGRVTVGLLAGALLLGLGERLARAAYRVPAQGLTAAGLATLYLSVYAAHVLYRLVGELPAFGFMALTTATGIGLAIRHDAQAIALLASLGGLLTPILLASGRDAPGALFTYLGLLDAGILASAYWRRWTALQVVAFAGTQLVYSGWFSAQYRPSTLTVALAGATGLYLLFALIAPVGLLGRPRDGEAAGEARRIGRGAALVALAAPLAYFAAARAILAPAHRTALGLVCLAVAALHALLGAWTVRRPDAAGVPAVLQFALAVAFLTLIFPAQFAEHTVVIAWSAEAIVLLWGGFRLADRRLRVGALLVLALAGLRWLWLIGESPGSPGPFLTGNPLFLATVGLVAGAVAAASGYRQRDPEPVGWEAGAWPALMLGAVSCTAGFVTVEIQRAPGFGPSTDGYRAVLATVVWAVATVPLLLLAAQDRTRIVLGAATLLLGLLALISATVDVEHWRGISPLLRRPVLNVRFLEGMLLVALWQWYRRLAPGFPVATERGRARLGALAGGVVAGLLLWHLSAEVLLMPIEGAAPKLRQLGLTVLWTFYALGAMALGLRQASAKLRLAALALFGLTVAKVFMVDLAGLDAGYRILSFLLLGSVLILASFVYARSGRRGAAGQGT